MKGFLPEACVVCAAWVFNSAPLHSPRVEASLILLVVAILAAAVRSVSGTPKGY